MQLVPHTNIMHATIAHEPCKSVRVVATLAMECYDNDDSVVNNISFAHMMQCIMFCQYQSVRDL